MALARHQWEDAAGWLRQALTLAQAVGNPTQLWKTHLAWGRLHTEAKRPEMAQQAYRAAREVVDQIQTGVQDQGLRGCIARSPLFQQVRALSPAR
jgi:hypothetical protein